MIRGVTSCGDSVEIVLFLFIAYFTSVQLFFFVNLNFLQVRMCIQVATPRPCCRQPYLFLAIPFVRSALEEKYKK